MPRVPSVNIVRLAFNPGRSSLPVAVSCAVVLALVAASCSRNADTSQADVKTYDIRGTVIEVNRQEGFITIDHEEIPGYMMAMAMPFRVRDTSLFADVAPGDSVLGALAVSHKQSWLQSLFVLGRKTHASRLERPGLTPPHTLQVGDKFPDFGFTNQDGRGIHMSDFDGRVVALTFIYTRCPLPDFCIQMTNHFSKVQDVLAGDPSLRDRWHLVTISFDPSFDTPSVLSSYGRAYHADFRYWDFVSDSLSVIMRVARSFGLVVDNQGSGTIVHNLRTVVLRQDRTIAQILSGNEWKPEELEALMRSLIREGS